ncbi:Ig-like domain-containing protein [Paenibacillus lignilyticus]|uniref:Tandem-95 repeat protein n=1 Tax=Paenibacillus lignilyticus TaxID=1172615 RepID=A0ABS5CKP1_9BACL|nr:Ig-like domain-containing protein [Paenibacillus lignilyticus]MBP3966438.1 tandem-95 repeat protein [Paenibacillus lignilyticus]
MTKKQRKQRLKSVKKAAQLFGTATALAVPVALAVPGFASADPVAIPQPVNLPVVIKSINSTLANEYASKIKAGSNFQLDLNTIFEEADTLEYTVVVQNNSVADVKVTSTNKLAFNLKKTGSTMVDLIVHKPNESMSIHERFTLKVGANGALDPDQDGAGIADIIKYFNSHAGEFHSTGDYRTLLQAAVSSTVPTPNHAPFVSPETTSIVMPAGTYTEIQLNDLFSDEDGDELSFELIDPPSSSSFVNAHLYSETSTLVLTAVNPSSQSLIVTVDGTDGEESATKLFSVTVGAAPVVNHPPVAGAISFEVDEDGSYLGTFNGTDADETDTLTYSVLTPPGHGTLSYDSLDLNQFRYTPAAGFSGTDSFTYVANDGTAESLKATVSITINPVNDKPVANAISLEVDEDESYVGTFTGTDEDTTDTLTYKLISQPGHGTVSYSSLELNQFRYTPAANFSGTDNFTYVANDGTVDSEQVTVSITVHPKNDKPVANAISFEVDEDGSYVGTYSGTDVDATDTLTYKVISQPGNGTLSFGSLALNKFRYTPAADFSGTDSFTYVANDGTEDSEAVTVTITINPLNDRPEANAISFEVDEDGSYTGNMSGVDKDHDGLTYRIGSDPSKGQLTFSDETGAFTYAPNPGVSGADSFTYVVFDGTMTSQAVTVSITINPVNDKPVADAISFEVDEDGSYVGTFTGTDADETDTLTYSVFSPPGHGTLSYSSMELNQFRYTPAADFSGADSFTYMANDGTVDSVPVTVSITINPVNDKPVASAISFEVDEDGSYVGTFTGTDVDASDILSYEAETQPLHGTLSYGSLALNQFRYTPAANYNGTDSFTYVADDGTEESLKATVSITIKSVNDKPVANAISFEIDEDGSYVGTFTGTDVDAADILSFEVNSQPLHGTLSYDSLELNLFRYTLEADYNGSDSFTYVANDGTVDSVPVTVSITIDPVNDKPVASAISFEVDEDGSYVGTFTGTDADAADILSFATASIPSHGTLSYSSLELNQFRYTPAANYNGTDSFTYVANDGTGESLPVTVSITVTPKNDKPVVNAISFEVDEDGSYVGTYSGTDVDETDTLTYKVISQPGNGTLSFGSLALNKFRYTPAADFSGTDSFTYVANDGTEDSEAVTVSITINPLNDRPEANAISFEVVEDGSYTGNMSGVDKDHDGLTYRIGSDPSKGQLTFSDETGAFTYAPNPGVSGADSFTYVVFDGTMTSQAVTVSITINPVNDKPVADAISFEVDEDGSYVGTFTGTDADAADILTFATASLPSHGTLSYDSLELNQFRYTPEADYNGTDSFTYAANDGTVDSVPVTVSITINPVNDKPVANAISIEVDEDGSYVGTFTGTDFDEADILSFVATSTPSHGTLSYSSLELNQFRYTPYEDYSGTDSFTYKVNDGTEDSLAPATVSITVKPVNDLPTANELSVDVNVGSSVEGNLWGEDLDEGDSLSYSIVTAASHGTVTISSTELGHFTYQQDGSEQAFDSFTYRVYDGTGYSQEATVSISIHSVNAAPIAEDFEIAVTGNAPYEDILRGGDADGDELTYSIYLSPGAGSVELNPETGEFTYTPMSGVSGADSFAYQVYDGKKYSNIASVVISIAENELPTASDMELQVPEAESHAYVLEGSDVNTNDILSYSLLEGPQHGELIMNEPEPGMFTYTPTEGYSGSDSFTYVVNDGWGDSNTATVYITVGDGRPKAIPQTVETLEDEPVSGTLSGAGGNGEGLQFFLGGTKVKGDVTLDQETGEFTYTPNENANGVGSFTFKVYDGTSYSDEVTVTVNITPEDDEPIAGMVGLEGYIQLRPDQTAMLDLSQIFTEVDGQQLTYRATFQGNSSLNGTLNGSSYYLNALGSPGFTSFDLQASDDGFETYVSAPVMVQVDGGNLPDVEEISNDQDEYTVDLSEYFYGYFDYVAFDAESGAMLPIEESTLTVPLEDDDIVTVVVSARDGYGLTITDTFNLYVGIGFKDIGVQFFDNNEGYEDHNAYLDMKDIFHNAVEFQVTAYNEEEIKGIGSYTLGVWTVDPWLNLSTDVTFTTVSEVEVKGRTADGIEKSYTLRIRENTAPTLDGGGEAPPILLKKGETVELAITDAEGDPITSVIADPDDSICGDNSSCVTATYADGKLFVTAGMENGSATLDIMTSDGLPFGTGYSYRTFIIYDDSIDIVDDFSIDKELAGLLAGMDVGSLTLVGVESEYMIHDPGATLNGTTLHFDVNSEAMYPGDSEFITVTITDGNITRVLTLYMNVAWTEIDPGSA